MNHADTRPLWRWASDATRLIRFGPDRARVCVELVEHMRDATDEHISSGMSEAEATARAVAAMGDAEEVAEHLARLYRPFWGFAWKFSRLPAFLAILYLLYAVTFGGMLSSRYFDLYDPESYMSLTSSDSIDVLADLYPTARARVGGYAVSVPRLRMYDQNGIQARQVIFVLRMSSADLSLIDPKFYNSIYATDDLGNIYPSCNDERNVYRSETTGNTAHVSLFSAHAQMRVSNFDRAATVLTLHYDRFGQHFTLEIPLEVLP